MADLTMITNNGSDEWVDNVPSAVSSGYQAQNTNITTRSIGNDMTTVTALSDRIVVSQYSGHVDIGGVPFKMQVEKVFLLADIPSGSSYLVLQNGANDAEKVMAITALVPSWDDVKYGYYSSGGERVLQWIITKDNGELSVRKMSTGLVISKNTLSGIGIGGYRSFYENGLHTITVARDGFYEVFAIGGGSSASISFSGDASGGYGGTSATAIIRLSKGDVVTLYVAGADENTTVDISSKLDIDCPNYQGATVFAEPSITQSYRVFDGGDRATSVDGETGDVTAISGGGGAGRYSDGLRVDCLVENFGLGGSTDGANTTNNIKTPTGGFVDIKWLGE